MFRCSRCEGSVAAKIPQARFVTETRLKNYYTPDPDNKEAMILAGSGREIVSEEALCPTCAGHSVPAPIQQPEISSLRAVAVEIYKHSKGCKKSLSECETCQRNMKFFADLSPSVLNGVLA